MDNQSHYIWQQPDWPRWRHDLPALFPLLIEVCQAQGRLLGRLQDLGEAQRAEASLGALTEDVLKTSEIEGESLDVRSVRSSLARRLGVDVGGVAPVDRHVEGVVEMVLDATTNCHAQLTVGRLFGWHAALFPTGYSGMVRIGVGQWRTDARGPMQVVSGPVHRPRVHFQAPPAATLPEQMAAFLAWANAPGLGAPADVPVNGARADALLKARLSHPCRPSVSAPGCRNTPCAHARSALTGCRNVPCCHRSAPETDPQWLAQCARCHPRTDAASRTIGGPARPSAVRRHEHH